MAISSAILFQFITLIQVVWNEKTVIEVHLKENGEKLHYIYGVQKFPHESASLYNMGETEK